jgi:hypothetical protein
VVIGGGMGALHYGFQHLLGVWSPVAAFVMVALSAAVSAVTLPLSARFLDARREAVLLAMK